jgi:hypothetical protein
LHACRSTLEDPQQMTKFQQRMQKRKWSPFGKRR